MDRIKCNDIEAEIVKEESEQICGLIFPLQDSGSCLFHFFLVSRALVQITGAATKIS